MTYVNNSIVIRIIKNNAKLLREISGHIVKNICNENSTVSNCMLHRKMLHLQNTSWLVYLLYCNL